MSELLRIFPAPIRSELRATLGLAGPVVAAQLAHVSMSFVDTMMVGRLGPDALAGVALGHTTFFFFAIMGMGVVRSVGPMVSQAVGAGDSAAVGRSVRQGLWLALGLGLVILVILSNVKPVLRWTGQDATAIKGAAAYLRAVRWGILPFLGFIALRSYVESLSRPLVVTVVSGVGVVLNVAANELLMFGRWGFPKLGLAGTGWASTLVFVLLFVSLSMFVDRMPFFARHRIFSCLRGLNWGCLRELLRVGLPMGVSRGIEVGMFMGTTLMMGTLGATALAAHQVAFQCATFTFMVPLGISMAGTVRVGRAAGRRDVAGARRAGAVTVVLATLFMTGAGVLFWTLPRPLIGLYLDLSVQSNAEAIALAAELLGIAAFYQIVDGIQVATNGALQGLKDTRVPMGIALFTFWGIGLATGYIWGIRWEGGPGALWWGLMLGLSVAAILLLARFHCQVEPAVRGRADTSEKEVDVPEAKVSVGSESLSAPISDEEKENPQSR